MSFNTMMNSDNCKQSFHFPGCITATIYTENYCLFLGSCSGNNFPKNSRNLKAKRGTGNESPRYAKERKEGKIMTLTTQK